MIVVADQLWVCVDCLMYIANGDLPEDPADHAPILAGIAREHPAQWVCEGPHEGEDEEADQRTFPWRPCACCLSTLGGSRGRCALLGEK